MPLCAKLVYQSLSQNLKTCTISDITRLQGVDPYYVMTLEFSSFSRLSQFVDRSHLFAMGKKVGTLGPKGKKTQTKDKPTPKITLQANWSRSQITHAKLVDLEKEGLPSFLGRDSLACP